MLTQAQISHFHTFGFLVLRQVFDAEEVAVIRREADEIFAEDRNGGPITPERPSTSSRSSSASPT